MGKLSLSKMVCIVSMFCAATAISSPAQTLTTLASFNGTVFPHPLSLIQGTDGNFYGTTENGGANNNNCTIGSATVGCGTVFKITPAGTLTTLHNFNYADGFAPSGRLVQGTDGNFYGTTSEGGTNGQGTVFKITPGGTLTTLYSFCSPPNCTDGAAPQAGLVQATDGNFYGTTNGTVFKITSGGMLTTLYSFCTQTNCPDGWLANGLVQATDGNFYGTTNQGGANSVVGGTVFKITSGGTLTTLHSFCAQTKCTDGDAPVAGLVQGIDGNFYGTTLGGGANGQGTVFKITSGGTLTTLHSFCAQTNCTDGNFPNGLVQATDRNFYGTTAAGGVIGGACGTQGCGTVFKITPAGTLTTLYSFLEGADGGAPQAGLVQATDGNFYGTTTVGGANGLGTVFKLSSGVASKKRLVQVTSE